MTPNRNDFCAQESPVGLSATPGPSSVAGDPARSPFDEMVSIANRNIYKAERYRFELEMAMDALRQIEQEVDELHLAALIARGMRHQIERLLAELESG